MQTGPDDERLTAISGQLARLIARQEEMERRLERLEGVRGEPVSALPVEAANPAPDAIARTALETRMGLTWLNRVGVVTLVLGFAFFFKYAVDNRWIGERGRIALGIAAGLAALAWSWLLRRGGQRVYAQGICGAGIAILYVSLYASVNFYQVLSVPAAFVWMSVVTVASGWLSRLHSSAAIASLGLAGGFATPLVLDTSTRELWFLFSYLLLLDAGALWVARTRGWKIVEWIALAGTYTLLGMRTSFPPAADTATPLMFFPLLFAGLFSAGSGRLAPAVALAAALAWSWGLWFRGPASAPQWLLFAGIAAGLGCLRWFAARPAPLELVAGWIAAFLLPVWPAIFAGHAVTLAWCASCAAIAWLARRAQAAVPGDGAVIGLAFLLARLFAVEAGTAGAGRLLTFAAASAAFWFSASQFRHRIAAGGAWLAGHASLLWIVGAETVDWDRRNFAPENLPSILSLSISTLIAAYGVVLVGAGVALRSTVNRVLGLCLLGGMVLKLYCYDIWQLGRLFRFAAFGGLGALLLLASYLYSRYRDTLRAALPGRGGQ
jgi:uncharacterized membrane protein